MAATIRLKDTFLAPRQKTCIEATIPSALQRCEETGRLHAFHLEWKPGSTEECPHIYWDSDVAKVMEGMAYVSQEKGADEIASRLDELTALVISAQQPDGYINTHFTVCDQDKRWKNLGAWHELYCAGHLIEAAVARFEFTGKRDFLDAMCRYADYICDVFGPEGCQGYPGHEELELALIRLFRVTGNRRYLDQSRLFLDRRGTKPFYFLHEDVPHAKDRNLENLQAHRPVREQHEAVGHSVRAVYLYSAMADVAKETGDEALKSACEALFDDIVYRKMYLTGGIGSRKEGESFGKEFELPLSSAYAESCAAIGLVLFSSRMFQLKEDPRYADVIERLICNGAISGISLSGDKFFYSNPQQSGTERIESGHIRNIRQPWYSVSCCPTSYCRFLPQLGRFCCRIQDSRQITLDIAASMEVETSDCALSVESGWPWNGKVRISIRRGDKIRLRIRIPDWSSAFTASLPGETVNRYWTPAALLKQGEELTLAFGMKSVPIHANPLIESARGRAAIMRGPLVYCIETVDCKKFVPSQLYLPEDCQFEETSLPGLPEGTVALKVHGWAEPIPDESYESGKKNLRPVECTAIPYALWQNRGDSEMGIFFPVK